MSRPWSLASSNIRQKTLSSEHLSLVWIDRSSRNVCRLAVGSILGFFAIFPSKGSVCGANMEGLKRASPVSGPSAARRRPTCGPVFEGELVSQWVTQDPSPFSRPAPHTPWLQRGSHNRQLPGAPNPWQKVLLVVVLNVSGYRAPQVCSSCHATTD